MKHSLLQTEKEKLLNKISWDIFVKASEDCISKNNEAYKKETERLSFLSPSTGINGQRKE